MEPAFDTALKRAGLALDPQDKAAAQKVFDYLEQARARLAEAEAEAEDKAGTNEPR